MTFSSHLSKPHIFSDSHKTHSAVLHNIPEDKYYDELLMYRYTLSFTFILLSFSLLDFCCRSVIKFIRFSVMCLFVCLLLCYCLVFSVYFLSCIMSVCLNSLLLLYLFSLHSVFLSVSFYLSIPPAWLLYYLFWYLSFDLPVSVMFYQVAGLSVWPLYCFHLLKKS